MKIVLTNNENAGELAPNISFTEADGADLPAVNEKVLYGKVRERVSHKSGLLPPAVRWISADKNTVVFERPPSTNRIAFYPALRDKIRSGMKLCEYHIPIPWQVYIAKLDDHCVPVKVHVFARNEPVSSLDDRLFLMPLLNLYGTGELCPPIFERFESYDPTLSNGINAAYNMVWNSGFNYDLADAAKLGLGTGAPTTAGKRSVNGFRTPRANITQSMYEPFVEPRPSRRIRTLKVDANYGGPLDGLMLYYEAWSKMSFVDVLKVTWPIPSKTIREAWDSVPTIRNILEYVPPDEELIPPVNLFLNGLANSITTLAFS